MTRRIRQLARTGAVITVPASAACAGDTAGVDIASESIAPTSDGAVLLTATIDAAAVEQRRAAAALDPRPDLGGTPAPASGPGDGLSAVALNCLGDGPAVALGSLPVPYVINIWGRRCALSSDDDSPRLPLRIVGAPLTLFVDADGRVVGRKSGAFESASVLRAQIDRYFGPAE